jgi:hypothetical protein
MAIPKNPRITINKTTAEWDYISSKLKELKRKKIETYLNGEVEKLIKAFMENPNSVIFSSGKKKEIQFRIEPHTCVILKQISQKMNKPVNAIVDDFIITPLLSIKP